MTIRTKLYDMGAGRTNILRSGILFAFFLLHSSGMAMALPWHSDLNGLPKKGPIFIHFYSRWCSFCKMMQAETFGDPRVEAELRFYTPVMIDIDVHPDWREKFNIGGVPDNRVYNGDLSLMLMRIPGYMPAAEFASELEKTREFYLGFSSRIRAYGEISLQNKPKRKKMLATKLADDYFNMGEYKQALDYYRQGVDLSAPRSAFRQAHKGYGYALLAEKRYREAARQFGHYLSLGTVRDNAKVIRFLRAYCLLYSGQYGRAARMFERIIDEGTDADLVQDARYYLSKARYLAQASRIGKSADSPGQAEGE